MKYFNCPMSSSLFSSFQENTKCESSFIADTCTPRVPIFVSNLRTGIVWPRVLIIFLAILASKIS